MNEANVRVRECVCGRALRVWCCPIHVATTLIVRALTLSTAAQMLSRAGSSSDRLQFQGHHDLIGRRLRGQGVCGFHSDCPLHYELAQVNRSAALWNPSNMTDVAALQRRHDDARSKCARGSRIAGFAARSNGNFSGTLDTGGWCLEPPVVSAAARSAALLRDQHNFVTLSGGHSYFLPKPHVAADRNIVDFLACTLRRCDDPPECSAHTFLSVVDMGAGIGQYGRALLSRDPRHRWRGYDGAGNVEEVTSGFVSFFDLTIPLSLQRADWASEAAPPLKCPSSEILEG